MDGRDVHLKIKVDERVGRTRWTRIERRDRRVKRQVEGRDGRDGGTRWPSWIENTKSKMKLNGRVGQNRRQF